MKLINKFISTELNGATNADGKHKTTFSKRIYLITLIRYKSKRVNITKTLDCSLQVIEYYLNTWNVSCFFKLP